MNKAIIYGLYSSRDDELRYIGQTTQTPGARLRQHRNYAKNKKTAVHKWFNREKAEGFSIEIRVLCEDAIFNDTEIEYIASHRALGARLLNLTDGGEGTVGWHGGRGKKRPDNAERNRRIGHLTAHPMSPQNKEKLIAAVKARNTDYLVQRNKTSHPWIGKKHTAESRAKISAAHKGKVVPPEVGRKISAAKRARKIKLSPEAIVKLRAAHRAYYEKLKAVNA